MRQVSWEYLPVHKEEFGEKYIEIFEYCSKYVVRIGCGMFRCLDVLETEDEVVAWTFFNEMVECFSNAIGGIK